MLRELRGLGYVRLIEHRDEQSGQIERYEYLVRMRPQSGKPLAAEPPAANPPPTVRDSRRQSSKNEEPPVVPQGTPPADQIRRVFDEWKSATGRNGTTGYDDKRKRAIKGRLGDGFTPEQLITAVQTIPLSDFHNGRHFKTKDADAAALRRLSELTLHLRDAEHVETLLALAGAHAAPGLEPAPRVGYVASDEELLASASPEEG